MLRFATRWWPHVADNNLLRWYGSAPYTHTFTEILDLTDAVGAPIVVFYAAGPGPLAALFTGRSDAAVTQLAVDALAEFTRAFHCDAAHAGGP